MKRLASKKPGRGGRPAKTLRVRKNGKTEIGAQMRLPLNGGTRRIMPAQAAFRWMAPGIAAFTPRYVEMVLNGALAGDHVMQHQMFDMMLRTWPVLESCQKELVDGVLRREVVFDPYREEDALATESAIEREKVVTTAFRMMQPEPERDENAGHGLIRDILDAWFRGISVQEIVWDVVDSPNQGMITVPVSSYWVDPCRYAFNSDGILGLILDDTPTGYGTTSISPGYYGRSVEQPKQKQLTRFPPNKFLIAIHKVKSGNALSGAMLVPLCWWWCAANFSSDWLLNLAQIFGLPFRWASYPATSNDQTVTAIGDMLTNMGSAGWAAFPEGTTLELKEASLAIGGHTPQGDLLDRADAYARIVILGQTLTGQTIASGRGGQAFGTVEAQGKQDRVDAACSFVSEIINRQLIPAIIERNYGDRVELPTCRFTQESEGTYQDAQRDQMLTNMGLPIPISYLQQKYNVSQPTGDEEVTEKPEPPPPPMSDGPPPVSNGPEGTRPVGQTPEQPSKEQEQEMESRLGKISQINDDEVFARELRKLAKELLNKGNK